MANARGRKEMINNGGSERMSERMDKKPLLALLAALVLAVVVATSPAFAGMSLSPASGTYTITRQGGTIQFVVGNSNTEARTFEVTTFGGAAADGNKFVKKIIPDPLVTIKARDFKTFYAQIVPDNTVEYGRKYVIGLRVMDAGGAEAGTGIGAGGKEASDASFYVVFENKGMTVNYGGFDEEATRQRQAELNRKPNYLPLILAILLIILLLAGLFFFIAKRRKKEKEEEEIVVQNPEKPA